MQKYLLVTSWEIQAGSHWTLFRLKDRKCNPSLLEIIGLNSTTPGGQEHVVQWWDAQGIVGLILFLMCVLYSR